MISLCVRYVALIFVVVFTEFTNTEREQPAFCLGKYKKDSIVKDCVEVSSLFKDIETLKKINLDVNIKRIKKDSIVKDCVEVSSLFKDIETLKKSIWMLTLRIETK